MAIRIGRRGADVIDGTRNDDLIFGGGGDDVLRGLGGNDLIFGGDGNDNIQGGDGDDLLFGDAGNDMITGGAGRNVMFGGAGDDVFIIIDNAIGDPNTQPPDTGDFMFGGAGADRFVLIDDPNSVPPDDSGTPPDTGDIAPDNPDFIGDFQSGIDTIDLSQLGAYTDDGCFHFAGNTETVRAHSVSWFHRDGLTIVQADVDGDARADVEIHLFGLVNPPDADFVLADPPEPNLPPVVRSAALEGDLLLV